MNKNIKDLISVIAYIGGLISLPLLAFNYWAVVTRGIKDGCGLFMPKCFWHYATFSESIIFILLLIISFCFVLINFLAFCILIMEEFLNAK